MCSLSLSVVVPTYNTPAEQLERSLNSVLAQSYTELEVVVVDDGGAVPFSGLNSSFEDPRIKWLALDENIGVARARNAAVGTASGELIAFLDAGDWWEPDKLEKQVKCMISEEVDWVYCGVFGHGPNGKVVEKKPVFKGNVFRDLLKGQIITGSCSSVIVRKSVFDSVGGFHEGEDIHEDWDLWIKVSKQSEVSYVDQALSHIMVFDNTSRSQQLEGFSRRKEQFIRLHEDDLRKEGLLKDAWARHYLIMGRKYFMQEAVIKGISCWLRLLRVKPTAFPFRWLPVLLLMIFVPSLYKKIVLSR